MLEITKELARRREKRKQYFKDRNPDSVRNTLTQDFKTFLLDVDAEHIEALVEFTYHPNNQKSWGDNIYFQTLLAIADQLFIYQHSIQPLYKLLHLYFVL